MRTIRGKYPPFAGVLVLCLLGIKYEKGVTESEARQALDIVSRELKSVSNQTGIKYSGKLEVRIYGSAGKFLESTGTRQAWRGSRYVRAVLHVQPVAELIRRNELDRWLGRGVVEAVLTKAGVNGCPIWLREAYAAFHTDETRGMRPPQGMKLTSFSDLTQALQDNPEPPRREDVQFVLAGTLEFLVDTYGEKKAMKLFKAFDGSSTVEVVFKNTLGKEYSAVEQEWATHMNVVLPGK
jgi:hypothetical protein